MIDIPERVYFADLETTGFSPQKDRILLAGFISLADDANPVMIGNMDMPDDGNLAKDIRDFIMDETDTVYWWNGYKFDLPFTIGALDRAGERPFAHSGQVDLMLKFKQRFPYLDGKLETAARALGVEYQKTELDMSINYRCADDINDVEAWAYLTQHCDHDIRATKEVFQRMYGLISE